MRTHPIRIIRTFAVRSILQAIIFFETTAFEDPELLSLPEDFIPEALKNYSELIPFTHYLENTLRMKSHTLSKEEEALMSLTMDLDSTPQSIFYMFNNADIRF